MNFNEDSSDKKADINNTDNEEGQAALTKILRSKRYGGAVIFDDEVGSELEEADFNDIGSLTERAPPMLKRQISDIFNRLNTIKTNNRRSGTVKNPTNLIQNGLVVPSAQPARIS